MHPKSSIRSFHQRTIHQGHSNVSLFNLHCFAASFTELSGQFALHSFTFGVFYSDISGSTNFRKVFSFYACTVVLLWLCVLGFFVTIHVLMGTIFVLSECPKRDCLTNNKSSNSMLKKDFSASI